MKLSQILIIGLGGASGSILRYLFSQFTTHMSESKVLFPWGTFGVNIIGCLLIGILFEISNQYDWLSENIQLFFVVGFCGGFTTFSSYMLDGLLLGKESIAISILYIIGSICLGLLSVVLGIFMVRSIL